MVEGRHEAAPTEIIAINQRIESHRRLNLTRYLEIVICRYPDKLALDSPLVSMLTL
jgi:hypothetical protein